MSRPGCRAVALLAAAVACLAGAPAAAVAQAPETVVASLERPSPVVAQGGGVVYSDFDAATGRYRLTVREVGGLPLTLPFTPQAEPFDADLGTDSDGRAAVIASVGGDLFVLTIDRDAAPRPVRNVNTSDGREHAPAIDRGRIAFARGSVVYTKPLVAPRAQPSMRLPGVPTRRCLPGRPAGASCTTTNRTVERLDLLDGAVAQHVTYRTSGLHQNEVRHVVVATRQARQVAYSVSGEGAQRFLGVGFAGSRLSWYRGCLNECPARYTAFFRYRIGVGYDIDDSAPSFLRGFADTGDGTWQVRCASSGAPCTLVRTAQPRWERIAADRVRLPR